MYLKITNWCYLRFQIPNKCRVPDKRPLFNETIPLLQCMILCVRVCHHVCLCLYQRGKRAKDTILHIAIYRGYCFGILKKKHISAKVMVYRYMYTYNTWLQGRAYPKCQYVCRERTYVLVLPSKEKWYMLYSVLKKIKIGV